MKMNETALKLVKARIGISTDVRDFYLDKIIDSIMTELRDTHKLSIDVENTHHLMFIVDWADWRYHNRYDQDRVPRHLQYRLHNLIINNVVDADG